MIPFDHLAGCLFILFAIGAASGGLGSSVPNECCRNYGVQARKRTDPLVVFGRIDNWLIGAEGARSRSDIVERNTSDESIRERWVEQNQTRARIFNLRGSDKTGRGQLG